MSKPAGPTGKNPRVAIVHSWLNQYGGAERVLEQLHDLFPDAPIYTSMYEPRAMPASYQRWDIRTSFLQRVPLSRSKHQLMLFLYPFAFETFDLSDYDLVVSLSSGFSHGIRVNQRNRHVCYCLTPARFLWTFDSYVKLEGVGRAAQAALRLSVPYLRRLDYLAAQRVGHYVGISEVVRERILRFYDRKSAIIYPSIAVDSFQTSDEVGGYFLTASRLIPYKRIDLAIEACNRLKLPLKVVGDGRSRAALERLAGPTIEFLGKVDDPTLHRLYARCRAFIFPGEEDFGLTPIEAQASGRPVIAYGRGGTLETIVANETGIFFPEQSVDSLAHALEGFDHRAFDPQRIRAHARDTFDISVFRRRFLDYCREAVTSTNDHNTESSEGIDE
jgi:glycosyltransferase involved in cell wall biosynthesis